MEATTFSDLLRSIRLLADGGARDADFSQLVVLGLAVVCLTAVMVSTWRRIRTSQKQPPHTARERFAQQKEEHRAVRDVEQVMLELDQLSRDIHGRLDTKLARLETVIRDADDRIERLGALLTGSGRRGAESHVDVVLDEEAPEHQNGSASAVGSSVPAPAQPSGAAEVRKRQAVVYRLADEGQTPIDIARKLGQPVGEIELMLALRRTREQSSGPAQVSTRSTLPPQSRVTPTRSGPIR
ncbi:MAG: hypothetical protein PVI86_17845 [Phycisphaerae bacterium]|jgi:hypothetical protein